MISFYRRAFWAALAFAFVAALLPQELQLPGTPSDKVQHVIAFAMLATLGSIAYPSIHSGRVLVGLSAFGALIEILQAILPFNRDGDPVDWLADTIAAASVLAGISWWRRTHKSDTR